MYKRFLIFFVIMAIFSMVLKLKIPVIILVTTYFLHLHIASQVHVYGHKTTTLEVYIMVYIFKTTLYIDKYH